MHHIAKTEGVIRGVISGLLLCAGFALGVHAQDEQAATAASGDLVTIAATNIPYVFAPDLPGPYNQIFKLMAEQSPMPITLEYFPIMQAMRQLRSDQYDCFAMGLKYSPNWARIGLNHNDFTFIGPIAYLNIRVYVRPGEPIPTLEELKDMPVAVGGGIIHLRDSFDNGWMPTNLISEPSYIKALETLVAGDVKAVLAYDADVDAMADQNDLSGKFVDSGLVVAEMEDGIICKSTIRLLPAIGGLQAGLDQITQDGTLERLLAGTD